MYYKNAVSKNKSTYFLVYDNFGLIFTDFDSLLKLYINSGFFIMSEIYSGHLSRSDKMFEFLRWEIFSRMGCNCRDGIRVFSTNGSNAVYVYEDCKSNCRVVGKFFRSVRQSDWSIAEKHLERELRNINTFSQYIGKQHYVARVLGRNDSLNCLLVIEYCTGEALDNIIIRSINEKNENLLFLKLTALAYFLATAHNRSARGRGIDFSVQCNYFSTLLCGIEDVSSRHERDLLWNMCLSWKNDVSVWQDQEVLVHGDATPSNFLFGDGLYVIAFDMERVRYTDRCFDLGRLAAELQHFFLRTTGNKYAAEKFIGHFLWEYCCHFPDRTSAFDAICRRIPFYMGLNLLRIARNRYLDTSYRQLLKNEAFLTLNKG